MIELYSKQEIHQLTGYARPAAQAIWLKGQGIAHRVDGNRIILSRVHVQSWLEGRNVVCGGINFASVR